MKHKIFGAAFCLSVILIAVVLQQMPNNNAHRYHQHLENAPYTPCKSHSDADGTLCTHLPIVVIDTDGEDIPGKAVVDEIGAITGYTVTSDGQSEITAKVSVKDSGKNNHTGDISAVESDAVIHIRGNTSRTFDKSGYSIRLINPDGTNNPCTVMGMDSHHEWVLHGPYLDRTFIRNYMWYNIAGEIMDYAPNVRFCEVVINGEYNGLYVMTESITAGKNGARLSLSVDKKNSMYSGYLLRLDRGSSTALKNIDTFTKYTYRTYNQVNIVYPGEKNLTEEIRTGIINDFSSFEKAIYSYDYNKKNYGYKAMIDTDSFAYYFLINEFTCNYDAGWLSTYLYKDVDNRLKTCVWDMNSACDNYEHPVDRHDFQMQNDLWLLMLCKDEDFVNRIIKRYRELRKTYLNEEYLTDYIDAVGEYLGPAIDRNMERWGYTFDERHTFLEPDSRNPKNRDEAVLQMKDFIRDRGRWLDENIESLRQYSADSKNKKFNEGKESK